MPGKLTRTDILGLAGLHHSKLHWMRRQPDLRMSVIVKLSKALKLTPPKLFIMIVEEKKKDAKYARLHRIRISKQMAGTTPS